MNEVSVSESALVQGLTREIIQLKQKNKDLEQALIESEAMVCTLKSRLNTLNAQESNKSGAELLEDSEDDQSRRTSYISTTATPSRQFLSIEADSSDSGEFDETFNDSDTDISVDNGDVDLPRLNIKNSARKEERTTIKSPFISTVMTQKANGGIISGNAHNGQSVSIPSDLKNLSTTNVTAISHSCFVAITNSTSSTSSLLATNIALNKATNNGTKDVKVEVQSSSIAAQSNNVDLKRKRDNDIAINHHNNEDIVVDVDDEDNTEKEYSQEIDTTVISNSNSNSNIRKLAQAIESHNQKVPVKIAPLVPLEILKKASKLTTNNSSTIGNSNNNNGSSGSSNLNLNVKNEEDKKQVMKSHKKQKVKAEDDTQDTSESAIDMKQQNKLQKDRDDSDIAKIKTESFKTQLAFYVTRINDEYSAYMQSKAFKWLFSLFAKVPVPLKDMLSSDLVSTVVKIIKTKKCRISEVKTLHAALVLLNDVVATGTEADLQTVLDYDIMHTIVTHLKNPAADFSIQEQCLFFFGEVIKILPEVRVEMLIDNKVFETVVDLLFDDDITMHTKSLACIALDTFCDVQHSDIITVNIFDKIIKAAVLFMTKGKTNSDKEQSLLHICNVIHKITEECDGDDFIFLFEHLVTSQLCHKILSLLQCNEIKHTETLSKLVLLLYTIIFACDSQTEIQSVLVERPVYVLNKLITHFNIDVTPLYVEVWKTLHLISDWYYHGNLPQQYNISALFLHHTNVDLIDKISIYSDCGVDVIQIECIQILCNLIMVYIKRLQSEDTYYSGDGIEGDKEVLTTQQVIDILKKFITIHTKATTVNNTLHNTNNNSNAKKIKAQVQDTALLMETFQSAEFQSVMEAICDCKDISVKISSLATMLKV